MRADAPKIRSAEELYRKLEQVFDATERGDLTPKQTEQMNTTLKMMKALGVDWPMRLMSLIVKAKGVSNLADLMEDMRAPMVRTVLGLPEIGGR